MQYRKGADVCTPPADGGAVHRIDALHMAFERLQLRVVGHDDGLLGELIQAQELLEDPAQQRAAGLAMLALDRALDLRDREERLFNQRRKGGQSHAQRLPHKAQLLEEAWRCMASGRAEIHTVRAILARKYQVTRQRVGQVISRKEIAQKSESL